MVKKNAEARALARARIYLTNGALTTCGLLHQMIHFTEKNDAFVFTVKAVPRASKSEIVGEHDGALKVRIASPPVDGAANVELIKLLAKAFKVSKSDVEIIAGETSKTKQIRITSINRENFEQIVEAVL